MLRCSLPSRRSLASVACCAAVVGGTTPAASASGLMRAHQAEPTSVVGVIMQPDGSHSCTASVVHSESHDLVLTAAHCLDGDATELSFVPAYENGSRPLGTWKVSAAYVDSSWTAAQSEDADVAVLRLEPRASDGADVEDVTGALTLATGAARRVGRAITVESYNGDSDTPIACSPTLRTEADHPVFHCDGFVGGSSGSPWMQTTFRHGKKVTNVVGIIGGHHQGGCDSTSSYSSPFEARVAVLLARADAGGEGDVVPEAGSDGC